MQKPLMTWLTLLVLALAAPYVGAEIYQWKDAHGRIHFSDEPPEGAKTKQVEIGPYNTIDSPSKSLIDETLARPTGATGRKPKVILYSTTWCGVCKKAKRWLRSKGIPFSEYDVEKSERGRRDYKKLNGRGVPIIKVGKQRMSGFSSARLTDMLKKAGYNL